MELKDYIQVYDDAIPKEVCTHAIKLFEEEQHEEWDRSGCPQFTQEYMDKSNCRKFFPPKSSLEQFRLKKYRKGTDDRFERHVDVGDHLSAKRFLSLFWYLNDVEEGGETKFDELTIEPKQGRLLIFPPLWCFPHSGEPTISDDKYLVGTYCHYV